MRIDTDTKVLVVGWGELGKPLFDIVSANFNTCDWLDITPKAIDIKPDVMHIAFPCKNRNYFIDQCITYITAYKPKLVLIDSTVELGTTTSLHFKVGNACMMAHSPIRGNINEGMKKGLLAYTKFIGPVDSISAKMAVDYYTWIGLKTFLCDNPETSELAKLSETTEFACLIAFFQELQRWARSCNANYDQVLQFLKSTQQESLAVRQDGSFHPRPVMDMNSKTKGVIEGHCLLPNIELLRHDFRSLLLDWIIDSNEKRREDVRHTKKEEAYP